MMYIRDPTTKRFLCIFGMPSLASGLVSEYFEALLDFVVPAGDAPVIIASACCGAPYDDYSQGRGGG